MFSALLPACDIIQPKKPFTIGMMSYVPIHAPLIDGFKAGMFDSGYVEGEHVTYIYSSLIKPEPEEIEGEVRNLLAQDVDMLFTVGIPATLMAGHTVAGTDVPVVFDAVVNPVKEGIVESISHPGGNLTGVQVSGNDIPKALEWLVSIIPEAGKVYVPYNPEDKASVANLTGLDTVPSQLGIEIVLDRVYSVEEAVAAIESLPDDIDAIFRIPSPTLDPRNAELSQAAIARGLPMGAGLPLDEAVLITLATDLFAMGKQAARLADQIRQGAKPADLPVETAEIFLTINLKTAEAIGLNIPDEVLLQADTIIR
jgi:putative ABC transport system substrate-binding protein